MSPASHIVHPAVETSKDASHCTWLIAEAKNMMVGSVSRRLRYAHIHELHIHPDLYRAALILQVGGFLVECLVEVLAHCSDASGDGTGRKAEEQEWQGQQYHRRRHQRWLPY